MGLARSRSRRQRVGQRARHADALLDGPTKGPISLDRGDSRKSRRTGCPGLAEDKVAALGDVMGPGLGGDRVMTVHRTPITSRESWLDLRSRNIGGSEIAALFGEHPWKTHLQLYAEKAG